MRTLSNYPKKLYLGTANGDRIYLSSPSWDCGWYWGFGYLGNKNCHYHVDGLKKIEAYNFEKRVFKYEFVHLYDGLKRHFKDFIVTENKDIWTLAELFETFYILKEAAGVLGRGGSHVANNPASELIKNPEEVKRINDIVLPQIFEEIYKILLKYTNKN